MLVIRFQRLQQGKLWGENRVVKYAWMKLKDGKRVDTFSNKNYEREIKREVRSSRLANVAKCVDEIQSVFQPRELSCFLIMSVAIGPIVFQPRDSLMIPLSFSRVHLKTHMDERRLDDSIGY